MPNEDGTPTAEELAAQAAALEAPKEFSVTLSTGQVYKGANEAEVLAKVVEAQENASKLIKDQDAALREAEADLERWKPRNVPNEPGFDNDQYFNLLATDPLAAQAYALSELLGVAPQDVQRELQYIRGEVYETGDLKQTAAFHARHPEAPAGEEFAEAIIQRFEEKGMDLRKHWTADNIETIYFQLVHEGKITPLAANEAAAGNGTIENRNTMPSLGAGAGAGPAPDQLAAFSMMTLEQQEDYLRKQGHQV
jgi:hypothetical protein